MAIRHELRLHEELLLLALHDDKGTMLGSMYGATAGGAILAELLLESRVEVQTERKRQFVVLRDSRMTGAPILDDALERIRTAKRRASPAAWVSRFSQTKDLRHRTAQDLVVRGILRAEEDKVLFLFPRRLYPTVDAAPERAIVERLRKAIFSDTEVPERTAVLAALANAGGMLGHVFDKKALKARKARLEQIASGEIATRATKEALAAIQTAASVAATVAAVSAAT